MRISIIIPVYNVEKYLDKCLESVVGQTYSNLEIILVDDGSTDFSGTKCDEWAEKDTRIKVFHKINGGLMSAWKYGVERATGKYVGFVDSDDWIDEDMFEKLLKASIDNDAEMTVCSFIRDGKDLYKQPTFLENGVYSSEDIRQKIYPIMLRKSQYLQRGLVPARWAKLFERNVLLGILCYCDENVSIGEDLLTTFAVMPSVNTLVILGDFYPYHYRADNVSMIRSYSDEKYSKVENLKVAMLKATNLHDYDFTEQIHGDYIALMLLHLETEILRSGKTYKQLKESIKNRVKTESFQESLRYIDCKKFSFKSRVYLFLIKYKMTDLLISLRKLKKGK